MPNFFKLELILNLLKIILQEGYVWIKEKSLLTAETQLCSQAPEKTDRLRVKE